MLSVLTADYGGSSIQDYKRRDAASRLMTDEKYSNHTIIHLSSPIMAWQYTRRVMHIEMIDIQERKWFRWP